jgi:hypothetical protein
MKTFFTYLLFSALLLICYVEKKSASEAKRRSSAGKPVPPNDTARFLLIDSKLAAKRS